MGIRKYKPTTPGLRGMTVSTFEKRKRQDHRQTQRRRLQT